MDRQLLQDALDFAGTRIEELEETVKKADASAKGYKELTEAYNKWTDRYNEIYCQLNELDKVDIEYETLKFEQEKHRETLKMEQDKLRFEQEKFEYEKSTKGKDDLANYIITGVEIGAKVLVPVLMLIGTTALGKLAYAKDLDLSLCNGRVWNEGTSLMKLATMKI